MMPINNQTQPNKRVNATLLNSMGRSRGVALITAMLITALVAIAAAAMAERQQLDIRRTENLMHGDQAMIYAFTAESIVGDLLLLRNSQNSNTLEDLELSNTVLAMVAASIPIQGGGISFRLADMSGSFPLNRLIDNSGAVVSKYNTGLVNLLGELEWHDDENNKIVRVDGNKASYILDWIDADTLMSSPGAEDSTYLSRSLPYRTANQPLASLTELRLMAEMTNDEYNLLAKPMDGTAPRVNVLPGDGFKINVNTASIEVIKSLYTGPGVTSQVADDIANDIISARDSGTANANAQNALTGIQNTGDVTTIFKNVIDAANPPGGAGGSGGSGGANRNRFADVHMLDFDIVSSYFKLTTTVSVGRSQIHLISWLRRDATNQTVQTIRRGIGIL